MPHLDRATRTPTQRPQQVAASDTGQSSTAAAFLLASWNAKSCGGFDLTDLWTVDNAIARDMLAAAAFIATHREYQPLTAKGRSSSS